MPKVKLNDISIYYEVCGKGVPLLLIAGLGSDSSSWSSIISEFSPYFQVIIFDNRGSGRSDITQSGYTASDMAEDAISLLDFLKTEQVHILGHSMGGYIAQELAIKYPDRVNKLILESTAPVSSKRNNMLFDDIYNQLKSEGYSEAWFKRWTFWLFSPGRFADSQFIKSFIKNSMEYSYLQQADGFKSQIDAIVSFDARAKIGAIKAEALILAGKDDILITPAESGILAENIQQSIFQLLGGVAHCMHIENPKLFAAAVLEFLKP